METSKPWILRPVAWVATSIMFVGLELACGLMRLLGEYLTYRLDGLSTISVIIWTMLFGSTIIGIFLYSATFLSSLLVTLSDKIYPSNHAFRYYFFGICEIINCASLIISAIMGNVQGDYMFWFYAQNGWLIYASVAMMRIGRSMSEDRLKAQYFLY